MERPKVAKNAVVWISCAVKDGPFSGEKLVSFATLEGPVTGFVRLEELRQEDERWSIRAIVLKVEKEFVEVKVRGSFFTTNGLATISKDMALAA